MMAPARVSVVMPTHNRVEVLLRALDALSEQTIPPDQFEVVVVDDDSSDGTPERVAARQPDWPFTLMFLRQAKLGPAHARNKGLAAARGDLILFLDDDCIPTPTLIAEHLASHTNDDLAVIGRITWHPEVAVTPFMEYAEPNLFFAYFTIGLPFDATFACFFTGNASVRRDVAQALGGFDTDFPRDFEDLEFAYRMRRRGVRFVFNERALALHLRTAELLPTLEMLRNRGRECMRLWTKHPELHSFVPFEQLVSPDVRRRFYQAVSNYYLMLGVQDALAMPATYDPSETLPERFKDELAYWADRSARTLEAELDHIRHLRDHDLAEYARLQSWSQELEAEHARLQAAYAAQSDWANDIAAQLARLDAAPTARLRGLARRLLMTFQRRRPQRWPAPSRTDP